MTRIAVLDYGSGNVRSAVRAAERTGADVALTAEHGEIARADGLIVPGVGAFAAVMAGLESIGAVELIRRRHAEGLPTLAICVGIQVLFERGVEHGVESEGIGLWPGTVTRLHAPIVPHMGWAEVETPEGSTLFEGVRDERFYFVHSYAAHTAPPGTRATWASHGERFIAAIEDGPTSATQFHPEKSGDAGARLLANWASTLPAG